MYISVDMISCVVVTEHGADNYKILSMSGSRENKKEIYFFMFFLFSFINTKTTDCCKKSLCAKHVATSSCLCFIFNI